MTHTLLSYTKFNELWAASFSLVNSDSVIMIINSVPQGGGTGAHSDQGNTTRKLALTLFKPKIVHFVSRSNLVIFYLIKIMTLIFFVATAYVDRSSPAFTLF